MIATAYLRVYIPSIEVAGLPPHRGVNAPGVLALDDDFVWSESTTDDAIFTMWHDTQYACPRNARLRMLEGVVALNRQNPESGLVSNEQRLYAIAELSRLKRASAIGRSFILSMAWHVPLRWFCAFHPAERDVYSDDAITSIRYRTSLGEAVDRVRWAASVLEAAGFPEGPIEHLNELERWLVGFTPDAMVELDYGRVATLFNESDLVFDESAGDVRDSLLGLEVGDSERSGEGYARVARRWASPQAHTFTN
ncbi:MAG: hypothetical protein DWP92_08015 [Armatimonadetes bacterium]|nr:MAG: hypothetical protein DWP92_08015 [Armatimonadota bacterium]